MGIDAKDIGTLFWKILIFFTNTIYTYVTKYPIVSGVSAFIFLLYIFLPRLFYFMLYSSPFIACSAFYLRNHPSFKLLNIKNDNGLSEERSEEEEKKADLKHQRSVRRNARRKVEEVGKDWDSSQASEDERDKVILTTLYGEIPDPVKSPEFQKLTKDRAFLVSEDFSFESSPEEQSLSTTENVSVVDPSERLMSGGGETEIECSSSSSGGEEEEETSPEDKKVVAWTEDDQKNLMDLGNLEIERNKRLEHMITRRRMRRLVLKAAEGSLMDMEVPPISVGRNYFGLDQENNMVDGVQMPESAPSVLLPTKNPFDLPYDSQEEKPNLSGDSFQQEFAANPNDIFFRRHESFCRRVFPPENQLDSKWEPWNKKPIDRWPRPQQGSTDGLVEEKPSLVKGKDLVETNGMESEHRTEIAMSDSNSLLSLEERKTDPDVSNRGESSKTSGQRNGDHRVENPLVGLVPRNNASVSSSLAAERQRYMEHFGYRSRKGRKLSMESDLNVEFSEIGSPPTTVDGNISSDEEKALFVNELDTGKEISGEENEVNRTAESPLSSVEKVDQYITAGFSGEDNEAKEKNFMDTTAESHLLPVEKVDQDINETSSVISQETYADKQLEGMYDSTNVNGRCEEEEGSKSRDLLLENLDKEADAKQKETSLSCEENEAKQKNIVNTTAESHLLPVEKVDQDISETSSVISQETNVAKQLDGLSDSTNVNGRCEEEEGSKSRDLLLENSDKEAEALHINEVISKIEEESQELLQNSADEPEPSERRTNQESEEQFDGGQSTQEMQELVEPEVSNMNHVTSDESDTSPRSVLPDMSLPLDQTYTNLTSESLEEHTSDSQQQPIIQHLESPQNQAGGDSNRLETEGQI